MNTIISLAATAAVGLSAVAVPVVWLPDAQVQSGTEITADTALDADAVGGDLDVLSDLEISLGSDETEPAGQPRAERPWYRLLWTKLNAFLELSAGSSDR